MPMIYLAATFIGILFHNFAKVFPRPRKISIVLDIVVYVLAIIIIWEIFFSNHFITSIELNGFGNKANLGPTYLIWLIWLAAIFIVDSLLMLLTYTKLNGFKQKQLMYIIFGVLFPTFGVMPTNAILPLFGIYEYIWVGPLFMLLMNLIIAYGITRRRFLSMDLIVVNLLKIVLVTLILYIFFFTVSFINDADFIYNTASPQHAVVIGAIILLGLPVSFFISNVDQLIKKTININWHDKDVVRDDLSRKLSTQLDLDKISILILNSISKIFKLNNSSIIITDKNINDVIYTYSLTADIPTIDEVLKISIFGESRFVDGEPINLSEVEYNLVHQIGSPTINESHRMEEIIRIMEKYRYSIILSIPLKQGKYGLLCIGQKLNNDIFINHELTLLKALMHIISVSLGRAFLYEEVEKFNNELKDMVGQATIELKKKNRQLERKNLILLRQILN